MSKQYTLKTFPEWSPPLDGYQYRWKKYHRKRRVYTAFIYTKSFELTYSWTDSNHQWRIEHTFDGLTHVVSASGAVSQDDLIEKLNAKKLN